MERYAELRLPTITDTVGVAERSRRKAKKSIRSERLQLCCRYTLLLLLLHCYFYSYMLAVVSDIRCDCLRWRRIFLCCLTFQLFSPLFSSKTQNAEAIVYEATWTILCVVGTLERWSFVVGRTAAEISYFFQKLPHHLDFLLSFSCIFVSAFILLGKLFFLVWICCIYKINLIKRRDARSCLVSVFISNDSVVHDCVSLSPFLSISDCFRFIDLPQFGDIVSQGIVWIGGT